MTSLIERLESAEGPSRELDAEIHNAIWGGKNLTALGINEAPRYTESLDSALTLVPEGKYVIRTDGPAEVAEAGAYAGVKGGDAIAATAPLALCIASLRARGIG